MSLIYNFGKSQFRFEKTLLARCPQRHVWTQSVLYSTLDNSEQFVCDMKYFNEHFKLEPNQKHNKTLDEYKAELKKCNSLLMKSLNLITVVYEKCKITVHGDKVFDECVEEYKDELEMFLKKV